VAWVGLGLSDDDGGQSKYVLSRRQMSARDAAPEPGVCLGGEEEGRRAVLGSEIRGGGEGGSGGACLAA
jgi:hypothetical protein